MAVIGKIREKSLLLLIIIGGAMVAFILGDVLSSGGSMFGRDMHVAEINGKEISAIEYEKRVQEAVQNYEIQSGEPVDEATRDQLREQAWNEMLREYVLEREIEAAGLSVSSEELFDMVQGRDPHPQVKQAFSNPETGEFDPSTVIRFLKNMENDETGKTKAQWLLFEEGIKKQRLVSKYNTLIASGIHVTDTEARRKYMAANKSFDIDYVVKRYSSLPDSAVQLTESDIKAYYEAHKADYQQEASRKIEYIAFDVNPSEEDVAEAKAWIEETYEEFRSANDDSMYVSLNSDEPLDMKWYGKGDLEQPRLDTVFFGDTAKEGMMVGPYRDGEKFYISKLWDIEQFPDSVKARHILLKDPRQQNQQQQRIPVDSSVWKQADSLKTAIEGGADFGALAAELSQDFGTARDSGMLGWFERGQMVRPFEKAAFRMEVGDIRIVESQYGLHIIELVKRSELSEKVRVATVAREILTSRETSDKIFNRASKFSIDNNTRTAFQAAAKEEGLVTRVAEVKENDKSIPGLPESREIISWAYEAEEGAVSPPISLSGEKYIVATLAQIREEGIAPLEQVKAEVEMQALKAKKAKRFKKQMTGITDLQKLAGKVGSTVESAQRVAFSSFSVPGMGREPRVIGIVSTLDANQISVPIEGNSGVFVVKVKSVTPLPDNPDYAAARQEVRMDIDTRAKTEVFNALKEAADVKDRRAQFY